MVVGVRFGDGEGGVVAKSYGAAGDEDCAVGCSGW